MVRSSSCVNVKFKFLYLTTTLIRNYKIFFRNNTNLYVSSDNVGYASILLEKEYNPKNLVGTGDFVGAFASTNLGDVSPNIMGPKCEYTQGECDRETSTCPKEEGPCFASGPGKDMFESTKIIGNRIYNGASSLLKRKGGVEITGPLGFIIQNVDMTTQRGIFNSTNGPVLYQGCYPAMGYSFAAGTTDGVGAFDFEQGKTLFKYIKFIITFVYFSRYNNGKSVMGHGKGFFGRANGRRQKMSTSKTNFTCCRSITFSI